MVEGNGGGTGGDRKELGFREPNMHSAPYSFTHQEDPVQKLLVPVRRCPQQYDKGDDSAWVPKDLDGFTDDTDVGLTGCPFTSTGPELKFYLAPCFKK